MPNESEQNKTSLISSGSEQEQDIDEQEDVNTEPALVDNDNDLNKQQYLQHRVIRYTYPCPQQHQTWLPPLLPVAHLMLCFCTQVRLLLPRLPQV